VFGPAAREKNQPDPWLLIYDVRTDTDLSAWAFATTAAKRLFDLVEVGTSRRDNQTKAVKRHRKRTPVRDVQKPKARQGLARLGKNVRVSAAVGSMHAYAMKRICHREDLTSPPHL